MSSWLYTNPGFGFYPHSKPTPPPLLFSGSVRWSRKALFFKWLIDDDIWSCLKNQRTIQSEKAIGVFIGIEFMLRITMEMTGILMMSLNCTCTWHTSPLRSSSMSLNSLELCSPFVRFICRKLTLLFLAQNVCFCKVIFPCLLQLVQRNDF